MRFKKLNLKNIRSYEDQEINFSDGSLLLSGDIGSGKTSILLAIEYALFGLQPGQKGAALLRNESNLGEVELELEIEGNQVLIERKLKRSSKTVSNEYAAITINGQKIESSVTEIKTKILELLNYPTEFIKKNNLLYRYTIYTPQEQMKQIISEDPETRLNILRHIFGMDKYKNIRENLTILLGYLKEEIKALQAKIKELEQDKTKFSSLKEITRILEKKVEERKKELEINIKKREVIEAESFQLDLQIKGKVELEKEVEKTQVLIKSKRENLFSLTQEEKELQKLIFEVAENFEEERYTKLLSEIKSRKDQIENLNFQQIEIMGRTSSIQKNKEEVDKKRERLFKIDICPTCLQDVPEFHKHNILNESERTLVEIKNNLKSLQEESYYLENQLEKEKLLLLELEKEKFYQEIMKSKIEYLQKSKSKLSNTKKLKQDIEKDCILLEKHLIELKQEILGFSKFDTLSKIKKNELKLAFLNEKNSEISIAEINKELELTNKELYSLREVIRDKEETEKKLAHHLDLSDWLSNKFLELINFIEKNVLINLRREFSAVFNKWFQMLMPSDSFQVQLDESFTPLIIQNETEMEYAFLSGGERTAVALAYRLALNQTINSVLSKIKTRDIVILDEPTDGFSELQLDKMREVLEELNTGQLIIVSHEQKMESFVENILKVKKTLDISTIEPLSPAQPDFKKRNL